MAFEPIVKTTNLRVSQRGLEKLIVPSNLKIDRSDFIPAKKFLNSPVVLGRDASLAAARSVLKMGGQDSKLTEARANAPVS